MAPQMTSAAGLSQPQAIYAKLRPRPNGPGPTVVAHNQRVRLYGAMIEAVAAHGYAGTTVSELTALAGVSRRTFYEQFENRETCFLRTYELIVGRAFARMSAAWRDQPQPALRLRSGVRALAEEVVEHPKAARLAALEVLDAGPVAAARAQRTSLIAERMLLAGLEQEGDATGLTPAAASAIVGGITCIIRRRLLEGGLERLPEMSEELLERMLGHPTSPAAHRSGRSGSGRRDSGRAGGRADSLCD